MNLIYLGIGSNLGNRRLNIMESFHHLKQSGQLSDLRMSKIYETEPLDGTDQPFFLNTVIEAKTHLSPFELLDLCQKIEHNMGRKRDKHHRWAAREIDIDILFFEDRIIETPNLTIPHPDIPFRSFVIEPMLELNPNFIHPDKHITIQVLHDNLIRTLNIHEYRLEDEKHV